MKNRLIMKTKYHLVLVLLFMVTASCSFDEEIDPNGPSLEGVETNASLRQLNELAIGVQATSRNGHGIETAASGTLARELYLFDADPRNTGDLLGKNGIQLDNNSFYSTAQFIGSYRCIKNANVLLEALDNTQVIDETDKNGYRGFAKTYIAYELIQILKSYGTARVDVADPDNLGPFLGFDATLVEIRSLLNEAQSDLSGFGPLDQFLFPISGFGDLIDTSGEMGDDVRDDDTEITIQEFILFNRAIAALAAVYAGDGSGALTELSNSYFDLTGSLTMGAKFVFGLGAGDQPNGVFRSPSASAEEPNNADQIIVHDSWINDAEAGDTRVAAKAAVRPSASAQDGLNGTHEIRLYASNVAPIDIIRNEELILLYAEASILANNLGDAETAINVIRNAANIGDKDYGTPTPTEAQLTTEMLEQRRYSLWCENHRMFDLRRYDLSNTLPIDRAGDQVFNIMPIPLSENQ
ncbi:RagB/SusD family nutrient uptake outer membrane protein [uncultured Aquimarina sp.]|uniref:RagB/SusD family nutrient uptake outer membrane protein n=1 Tax=uncultured Aquimarina sp. TaxID=575652 RepID=UPI00261BE4D2|nr:RagB/SusD family nutrient uptake outer membrane protein [uncultured Aquimarina sp.]